MVFSSSPILYPPSSCPPTVTQKRKLFQAFAPRDESPKKPKVLGGFILDEGSDEEDDIAFIPAETATESYISSEALRPIDPNIGDRNRSSNHEEEKNLPGNQTKNVSSIHQKTLLSSRLTPKMVEVQTSTGQRFGITKRRQSPQQSYEELVAQRSATTPGRAKIAYYGVEIHKLIDEAKVQRELQLAAAEFREQNELTRSIEQDDLLGAHGRMQTNGCQMWTEKYRAKKFTDLVGDERTHRSVLRWLKGWDSIVFPGISKIRMQKQTESQEQQQQHRKVLLLTGPPGLGKTTLAHVCARQAGYEVLEINASDDRSRDVVKGRIKDALGTETVRGIQEQGKARKAGRPVCVIVDEVDGVTTGSGSSGGEGGFMKALIDLVQSDQRNADGQQGTSKGKKKGDKFRFMRPLILICNDVYAPSLRPLRQSSIAEIVHVRKPAIEKVTARLKGIFEKENIGCDNDAIRRLCESSWGLGTRKQSSFGGRGAGEGDIRGLLVQGEWLAHQLRALNQAQTRLTRKWVDEKMGHNSASHNSLGRGGVKDVVERVFVEGAGLPNLPNALSEDDARLLAESKTNPTGVADLRKRTAIKALREMIDTTGEHDRLMTECFATYPTQIFQDDTLLSKPNASYEWLHFHDMLSSKIYSGQEWELNPYLSTSACGFHDLFAAVDKGGRTWNEEKITNDEDDQDIHPFSGLKADFAAYEAEKANRHVLTEMQAGFPASMLRLFSSVDTIAVDLVSNVSRMLAPDVKPVVVGGSGSVASVASVRKESEKACVQHAVQVMHSLSIDFEKIKIESEGFGAHANGGYALRMEPPLDSLSTYHLSRVVPSSTSTTNNIKTAATLTASTTGPVRYAIRQVLSQELFKEKARQATLARQARAAGLSTAALSAHPAVATDDAQVRGRSLQYLEDITAIATATATLTSAPGSATVLPAISTAPVKKDFFGRPITNTLRPTSRGGVQQQHKRQPSTSTMMQSNLQSQADQRTWVSFHEGYSNAVRKYISLQELMEGF